MTYPHPKQVKAHPNSPNGCWARHGYRIERIPDKFGYTRRRIYAPDGTMVLDDARDGEHEYIVAHGYLLPDDHPEVVEFERQNRRRT